MNSNKRIKTLTCVFAGIMVVLLAETGIYITMKRQTSNIHAENLQTDTTSNAVASEEQTEEELYDISIEYGITDITEGDFINTEAIKLTAETKNGTVQIPAEDITFSENITEPLSAGINTVTITYDGKEYVMTVNAEEKNPMSEIMTQYKEEYENADYSYISDSLFITVTEYDSPDTYMLAHIITGDGNIPDVMLAGDRLGNKETLISSQNENAWIIGINASAGDDSGMPYNGVYIHDGEILSGNKASGNELCITDTGKMFTADYGTSGNSLLEMGVTDTIISSNPTLIKNGDRADFNESAYSLPKTVIAMVSENEYYLMTASNGTYTSKLKYGDICSILLEKGCTYAKVTDGNMNTAMVLNGEKLNSIASKDRSVIDCLVFYNNVNE
jgi:hypothetical protein